MKTASLMTAAGAVALLAALSSPAAAQDWSGPYVGGYAGYSVIKGEDDETLTFDTNLDGTYGDTVNTTAPANAFSPGFCDGSPNGNNAGAGCTDDKDDSGEVGVRAGYDMQFGSFVVGGVVDFGTGGGEDSVTGFSTTPANYSFERELDYLAAARLRIGYAYGRYLPYVTGGYANGKMVSTFSTSNGVNSFDPIKVTDNIDGYQLGAGMETKLTSNISVGLEYMYTSLDAGSDAHTVRVGPGTAPATNPFLLVNAAGTDMRRTGEDFEQHAVRLTMGVRF